MPQEAEMQLSEWIKWGRCGVPRDELSLARVLSLSCIVLLFTILLL